MSVYVDEIFDTPAGRGWPYRRACHMFADTADELHAMARKIGLARRWYQNRTRFPHYDLTPAKRALAIEHGATPVDRWAVFEYSQRLRRECEEPKKERS